MLYHRDDIADDGPVPERSRSGAAQKAASRGPEAKARTPEEDLRRQAGIFGHGRPLSRQPGILGRSKP